MLSFDCPVLVESTDGEPVPSKMWPSFDFLASGGFKDLGEVEGGPERDGRRLRLKAGMKVIVGMEEAWRAGASARMRAAFRTMHMSNSNAL
jgi:hypothetical protein